MSQIAFAHSKLHQVNRAIGWIKRNFRHAFSVDTLSEAGMSASALYQHFRTVTGMSPRQYQKPLLPSRTKDNLTPYSLMSTNRRNGSCGTAQRAPSKRTEARVESAGPVGATHES